MNIKIYLELVCTGIGSEKLIAGKIAEQFDVNLSLDSGGTHFEDFWHHKNGDCCILHVI